MSILSAVRLSVRLGGAEILGDVDIALRPGEVTAIVGPNGAGKSTLLGCLAGLRRPDRGTVRLDEQAVLALPPRRRAQRIGFLPQTPEVAWAVDGRTLVGLGRIPYLGVKGLGAADHEAVEAAMRAADVTAFADRAVTTLSGGERARVLIARALAGEPEWLLADEPLTGLDPGHQLDAFDLFARLAEQGRGVVVTLHDLSMALRRADRVLVMAEGGVLADGPPAEALSPSVLQRAYGLIARVVAADGGAMLDIVGRAPSEAPAKLL